MSQAHVERIIGRLATNEAWRTRYRRSASETLDAMLADGSLELTSVERRALLATPADAFDLLAAALDLRLQRLESTR